MEKFVGQAFLLSLKFVMEINFKHDIIAVYNLVLSWSISTYNNHSNRKVADSGTPNLPNPFGY